MISKTFFEQLELMAKEKEMSYEEILEATKKSLANAYKKSEGLNSNVPIRIELKPEKHEIQIYAQYMVVEEVKDIVDGEPCQVTLADAKKLKSNVKVGDTFEVAVDPKNLVVLRLQRANKYLIKLFVALKRTKPIVTSRTKKMKCLRLMSLRFLMTT